VEQQLTNIAFRRSPNDTDGLSVASSHEAAKTLLRSGCGVARLGVAEIAALGLTVVTTDDDHGYIDGLPPYAADPTDQNYTRAIELADRLLELSRDNITNDHWRRN
jgi:hypothetical protein